MRHQGRGRITQPDDWKEPYFRNANYPVVNVSWYEAAAFCSWLTEYGHRAHWLDANWHVRLPSEAEWVIAATWDKENGKAISWHQSEGEIWQNVEETFRLYGIKPDEEEPHTIVPVGLFPQGASPCGALDMAGNIWEWCSSFYENDAPFLESQPRDDFPQVKDDRSAKGGLVTRGGAWNRPENEAGWLARLESLPITQLPDTGFRVVKSPYNNQAIHGID